MENANDNNDKVCDEHAATELGRCDSPNQSMDSLVSSHHEEESAECGTEVCNDDDLAPNHDDQFPSDLSSSDESLQDSEDIDFEFVYALHTFVATVEGQANATKGDTMVLLDDSNSYWWLVRVVKDSSIGTYK